MTETAIATEVKPVTTRKKTTTNDAVKIEIADKEQRKMSKKTFNVTKTAEPITFDVDGEEFEAIPSDRLPAGALADYFQHINAGDLFKAHDSFFVTVLTEDSYERFTARLNSKENPITIQVLGDIAAWLLGDEYMGGKAGEEVKP
jgi:hypothetical protein